MERFKELNSIVKSSIGENVVDSSIKTTNEIKKLDEVYDAEEIFKMKKNIFEAWSKMVFMGGSEKRKYG